MVLYHYNEWQKVLKKLKDLIEMYGTDNVTVKMIGENTGIPTSKIGLILADAGIWCSQYYPKRVICNKNDLEKMK